MSCILSPAESLRPSRLYIRLKAQQFLYARECRQALSASALRVRLGQDRRSGVLASGAMRESERHRILHALLCQRKTYNFSVHSIIEAWKPWIGLQSSDRFSHDSGY